MQSIQFILGAGEGTFPTKSSRAAAMYVLPGLSMSFY